MIRDVLIWVFLLFALFGELANEEPDVPYFVLLVIASGCTYLVLHKASKSIELKVLKRVRELNKTA